MPISLHTVFFCKFARNMRPPGQQVKLRGEHAASQSHGGRVANIRQSNCKTMHSSFVAVLVSIIPSLAGEHSTYRLSPKGDKTG